MNRLLYIFIAALFALAAKAQDTEGPIVPLTERGYIAADCSTCTLGDTLRVHGVMLSTDYSDFYPYSRYVNVELVCPAAGDDAAADSVIVRQKVRLSDHGIFYATIPTIDCHTEGRYYLRAYTRFMRNRPVETFAMSSVVMTLGRRQFHFEGGDWSVACFPEGGQLQAEAQQRLVVYVRDRYGNPVPDAELTAVCGTDTLAIGETRASGYGSLSLMHLPEGMKGSIVVSKDGREMIADMPEVGPVAPALRVFQTGRKLRVQLAGFDDVAAAAAQRDLHLYAVQSGFGIKEYPIGTGMLAIDTSDTPDGLMTFWLAEAHNVLCQRSVWVGRVGNEKPKQSEQLEQPEQSEQPKQSEQFEQPAGSTLIRRIVSDNTPTLHAFEALCLLPQVRSDVPFPAAFYRETERDARTDLDLWLQTTRFVAFDLKDALAARFDYPFAPEQVLTLSGQAFNQQLKPMTYGSVEIVNLRTMANYVCDVDADGRYEQPVDDYWPGDQFFIESIDRIGKNRRYGASLEETTPPAMYNWLRLYDEANAEAGVHAATMGRTAGLSGGIDLGEASVTAQRVGRDWRTSQMDGLFYFDHEMLQDPSYRDLEAVLRRTGWVDIITGNSRPQQTLRNQGSGFAANDFVSQASGDDRVSSERYCRWRNGRNNRLNGGSSGHMNILLDGVLITHSYDYLLSSTVDNYESIEVVGPSNSDSRLVANYSPEGLIILRSRHLMSRKEIAAKGITVTPQGGITYPLCPDRSATLRPAEGQHIVVDLITPDRQIISWEE